MEENPEGGGGVFGETARTGKVLSGGGGGASLAPPTKVGRIGAEQQSSGDRKVEETVKWRRDGRPLRPKRRRRPAVLEQTSRAYQTGRWGREGRREAEAGFRARTLSETGSG